MENREVVLQKDRRKAMLISALIFLGVVAVCFFLTAFTIQDPPPGDQFVAVGMADFGDVLEAGGDNESEVSSEEVQEVVDQEQSQTSETSDASTDVATQNTSDMSVPSTPKPNPKPKPKPDPQPSNALSNALSNMNSSNGGGGSDGNSEGVGNEGDKNGQIDGSGAVQGDGVGFSLAGRGLIGRPKLTENPQEEGIVVLNVFVDRNGKVIRTTRNYVKSKVSGQGHTLFALAEAAAKTAKFSVKNDAPAEQKGEMTFRFELN
jgi:hypothetical protein